MTSDGASTSRVTWPAGLALDVADWHVQWVDSGANTVQRAGMDGLNQA